MAVTRDEIEKLAKLAKLSFKEEEYEKFKSEFDEIIVFANTINQSVVGGTEEIRTISDKSVSSEDLREDLVVPSLSNEQIVSNVQDVDGFFAVEKAIV